MNRVKLISSFLMLSVIVTACSTAPADDNDDNLQTTPTTIDIITSEDNDNQSPSVASAHTEMGEFLLYRDGILAEYAAQDRDLVLFFEAQWCHTCQALRADLEESIADFPKDLTIISVDYDTMTELKRKYDIDFQHTLVQVDSNGNRIAKWSHSYSLEEILNKLS